MQILDAYRARSDELKSRAFEQRQHLRQLHVAVPAPQMPCNALSLRLRRGEIDQEYPAAGFDDSSQLGHELPPGRPAEVMQHHRADREIEARVWKRQRLSGGILESHLEARPGGLGARPSQHFRRRIDATDAPGAANGLFRENRESTGSAAHIEHRLAGPQARKLEKAPAEV